MKQTEQQRWDELYSAYDALPFDAKKIASDIFAVEFEKPRGELSETAHQNLALELGLAASGPITHAMDGAQEYDDTLAGNEIYEALKEG